MTVVLDLCLSSSIPPWTVFSHSDRRKTSRTLAVSQIRGAESSLFVQQSIRRCLCYDMYKEAVPFAQAWSWQKSIVEERKALMDSNKDDSDTVIVLQHQPVYTLGTASSENNLNFDIKNPPLPLYQTERGGEVTYHGPGQLVMYPILNLRYQKMDLHWYLRALEEVVIRVLFSTFSLKASRIEGLTGVWVGKFHTFSASCLVTNTYFWLICLGDKKVAAIGIRVSRWLTYHGLALNVSADLSPFDQIVPCGIRDRGVGSIKGVLGSSNADDDKLLDLAHESLVKEFCEVFQLELGHVPGSMLRFPLEAH